MIYYIKQFAAFSLQGIGTDRMKSFFNPDNFIFRFSVTILDIVVLSLLWVVFCIPIITIGPATAALYYSAVKCIRFKEEGTYKNFFDSFRSNFRTGAGYNLVFLALAAGMYIIYIAIVGIFPLKEALTVPIIWGFLLFCTFLFSVFLCGAILLSRFEYTLSKLLGDSFRIGFGHLPRVYLSGLIAVAAVLLSIKFFYYQLWFITPCLSILLISKFMEPILRKYTPGIENLMQIPLEERPWYLK